MAGGTFADAAAGEGPVADNDWFAADVDDGCIGDVADEDDEDGWFVAEAPPPEVAGLVGVTGVGISVRSANL
jgi:hypothetical protein